MVVELTGERTNFCLASSRCSSASRSHIASTLRCSRPLNRMIIAMQTGSQEERRAALLEAGANATKAAQ
jgi:hypothetical protein